MPSSVPDGRVVRPYDPGTIKEIERAIADRIVARIPSDRLVPRSVNKGVPVVLDSPRSAVARSISDLAKQVIEG